MSKNIVTHAQLPSLLNATRATNLTAMMWGGPGIGKSQAAAQFAQMINAELLVVILSQYESVDLRGIPDTADGRTVWYPPATLPFKGSKMFPKDRPIVLFLDELPQATPGVANVAFQLCLDRRVGEHELMDNVYVVGAGNRTTDKANANRLPTPLLNRLVHFDLEVDHKAWRDHALRSGFHPFVIAFLDQNPTYLNTFVDGMMVINGTDKLPIDHAYATPRSWEFVSKIMHAPESAGVQHPLICGAVGVGVGTQFFAWKDLADKIPAIDDILADPHSALLPTNPAALSAISSTITQVMTKKNYDVLYTYVKRMSHEFQMRTVADIVTRSTSSEVAAELIDTPMFADFAKRNTQFMNGGK